MLTMSFITPLLGKLYGVGKCLEGSARKGGVVTFSSFLFLREHTPVF